MITPENNRLDHDLLAKYLAGETTIAESEKVDAWLAESDENWEEFNRLSQIWNGEKSSPSPTFDSKKAWNKVEEKLTVETDDDSNSRGWLTHFLLPVAAAVIGVIAITTVYQEFFSQDEVQMLTARTEKNTMEVLLADGSMVYLNENSILDYPESFNEDSRDVRLEGEAFFEIQRDTTKQFQIRADGSLVTVLGTSFNVRTSEELVEVIVETGKVALEAQARPGQKIELIAGEKGVYEKTQQQVVPSMNIESNHLFWKNRKLVFDETPLNEVVGELNEKYAAEISLASSVLNDCKLSGVFEDQQIEDILEVIVSTFKLEMEVVENQIILSGDGCD